MFPATFNMQLLAVVTLLLANTFANPIKRSDDETTVVRLPGLFGLFTTVATSALTTSEIVSQILLTIPLTSLLSLESDFLKLE